MALTVKQLNGDTTFLITFSPNFAPDHPAKRKRFPGDFTILLDPWLKGYSSIGHPSFQISHHTVEPEIASLKEIKEHVDLMVISQDKPDHCHRETLCSLSKDKRIDILATPAAAKKILSWKYFDERRVFAIKPYHIADDSTVVRIPLTAYSSGSAAGEVTIANLATKLDVTGLHNAIGITYQPPSTIFTLNTQFERFEQGTNVRLSAHGIADPNRAPQRPRTGSTSPPLERSNEEAIFEAAPGPTGSPLQRRRSGSGSPPRPQKKTLRKAISHPYLKRPMTNDDAPKQKPRADPGHPQPPPVNHEKVLSLIYTPHGLSPMAVKPYVQTHLASLKALPVTALFHSMNVERNPWFMGGKVAAGAPGGLELVNATAARYWVGAHDEVKDNRGVATVFIKSKQYDVEDVKEMLVDHGLVGTKALRLGVGETVRIKGGEW